MEKLYTLYKKYKTKYLDKILHFLACFFLTTLVLRYSTKEIAFVVVFVIGALTELLDKKFGGSCEARDLLADILGAVVAIL